MSSNTPQIIDGKAVAASVIETVVSGTTSLIAEKGITPGLAVIIVGEDPASQVYVASKGKKAKEVGFHSVQHTLPADASQEEVLAVVKQLNEDESIHGILCQLPVPKHLDSDEIIQSISPAKDVDGLHIINMGKLAAGDTETALLPCTPAGSMRLLREARGEDYSGLNAVVIGRSNLFGKPMGQLLLQANATVTMAHSRTADLAAVCKQADILVAAVGRAEMVKADWVKPGATVIDVGINRIPAPEKGEGKTRLVGDVAYGEVSEGAGAITPVPGGVGPMTIAMLMANTLTAACYKAGVTPPKY